MHIASTQRGVVLQRIDNTVRSPLDILNQAGFDLTACDIDISVGAHAFGKDRNDILVDIEGGGPALSLSAPSQSGGIYYEGVDDSAIVVSLRNFPPNTAYSISSSSTGGGTPPANATGTTDANGNASETIDITGLDAGQVTFTATAGAAIAARTVTLATPDVADAPDNVAVSSTTSGIATNTITWDEPASNGSAIMGYQIYVDTGSGLTLLDTVTEREYDHSNLIHNKPYFYDIRAVNAAGPSDPSALVVGMPTGVVELYGLLGQSNMEGQDALIGDDFALGRVFDFNGTDFQQAVSPITNDNGQADGGGVGAMSLTLSFVEERLAAPDAPDAIALVLVAVGNTAIEVWDEPGDLRFDNAVAAINAAMALYSGFTLAGFLHHGHENNSGSPSAVYQTRVETMIANFRSNVTGASATTPFVLGEIFEANANDAVINGYNNAVVSNVAYTGIAQSDGLTSYDNLHFDSASLQVLGRNYYSAFEAARLNAPGLPGEPTIDSVVAGYDQVTVSFTAPVNTGLQTLIDFDYAYRVDGTTTWTPVTPDTIDLDTDDVVISITATGQAFEIGVAAENASGVGEYGVSDPVTPVAPGAPAQVAKPTLTAGDGEATTTWTAPADNGSPIIDFHIQTRETPSGTPQTVSDAVDTETTETFAATNGAEIQTRVAAENAFGIGPYSEWSDAVTPSSVPSTPQEIIGSRLLTLHGAGNKVGWLNNQDITGKRSARDGSGIVPATSDEIGWICDSGQLGGKTAAQYMTDNAISDITNLPGIPFIAPEDTRRPILLDSSGYYYLETDGSNDYLVQATPGYSLQDLLVFVVYQEDPSASGVQKFGGVVAFGAATGDDWDQSDAVVLHGGGGSSTLFQFEGNSQSASIAGSGDTPLDIWEMQITGGTTYIRRDGADEVSQAVTYDPTHSGDLRISARHQGGSIAIFGTNRYRSLLIVSGAISDADRDLLRTNLKLVTGVS